MSILIRGMEMPKDGVYWCEIGVADDIAMITIHGEDRKSFPLVPVPPRGRLIDADALGEFPYNMDFCDGYEADEWVRNAPTIIPAEGVKT